MKEYRAGESAARENPPSQETEEILAASVIRIAETIGTEVDEELLRLLDLGKITWEEKGRVAGDLRKKIFTRMCDALNVGEVARRKAIDEVG